MRRINMARWNRALLRDMSLSVAQSRVCTSVYGVCDLQDGTHWCSYDTWANSQNQASQAAIKRHIRDKEVRRWLERVLIREDGNRRQYVYICMFPNENRKDVLEHLFEQTGWFYNQKHQHWVCINPIERQTIVDARTQKEPSYRDWTNPHLTHNGPGIEMIPENEEQNQPGDRNDPRNENSNENQELKPEDELIPESEDLGNPGDQNDPLSLFEDKQQESVCGSNACSGGNDTHKIISLEGLQEEALLTQWLCNVSGVEQSKAKSLLQLLFDQYKTLNQNTYRNKLSKLYNKTLGYEVILSGWQKHLDNAQMSTISEEQALTLITGTLLHLKLGETWSLHCNLPDEQAKQLNKTLPKLATCTAFVESWRQFGSWHAITQQLLSQVPGQCAKISWNSPSKNIALEFAKVWTWMSKDFESKQNAIREEQGDEAAPTRKEERIEKILARFTPMDSATYSGVKMLGYDKQPLPQQYWSLGMQERVEGKLNAEEARLIGWIGDIPRELKEVA